MNDSWLSYLPLKHIFSPLNCSPVLHLYSRRWVSILKNQSNLPPRVLQILCLLFFLFSLFAFPSSLILVCLPFPYSDISKRQRPHQKRKVRRQTWAPPNKKTLDAAPDSLWRPARPSHWRDANCNTCNNEVAPPHEPNLHTRRDTCSCSRWRRILRDMHLMKSLITLRWVRPVTDDISIPLKLRPLVDHLSTLALCFAEVLVARGLQNYNLL